MATIQCQGCGKRVMQKSEKCPHCGEPITQKGTLSQSLKSLDKKPKKEVIQDHSSPSLVECKACGKSISKNAVSCPSCGEPTVIRPQNSNIGNYASLGEKSRAISFLLTFFLGPIGLLYTNILWAVILVIITFILVPTGAGPVIIWMLSIFIGDYMINSHNKQLAQA